MKGNGKRILSIFLAAVIAVTTVWYAPPQFTASASWKTNMEKALELLASPSEASKQESTATPSEAEIPGREATPSEAEIPDGKATPSQAVKKIVRVEPEEIPEYYSQVSASGKRFWKFEDRNGMVQYRDYGYVQGDAEFPLWYVADLKGNVDEIKDSVNLDDEYYDLAPYIWNNEEPNEINWSDLEQQYQIIITQREKLQFDNWDGTSYYIWHIKTTDSQINYHNEDLPDDDYSEEEYESYADLDNENSHQQVTLDRYFLYGYSNNERFLKNTSWKQFDKNGKILNLKPMTFMSIMPLAFDFSYFIDDVYFYENLPKRYHSDTLKPYDRTLNPKASIGIYWSPDQDDIIDTTIGVTYTFIGWNDRGNKFIDIRKRSRITWEQTMFMPNGKFYGVWKYSNKHLLKLNYNYVEPAIIIGEVVESGRPYENVRISNENSGSTITLYKPSNNFREDDLIFEGWYSETNGMGIKYEQTITLNGTGTTTLYANWIPKTSHKVRFLYPDGSLVKEMNVLTGDSVTPPLEKDMDISKGYYLSGWDKDFKDIREDIDITAQYSKLLNITFDTGEGGNIYGGQTYTIALKPGTLSSQKIKIEDIIANTTKPGNKCLSYTVNGANVTNSYNITQDVTLIAVYAKNYSSIRFNLNNPAAMLYTYANVYHLDPLNFNYGSWSSYFPRYKGYTFVGWCENNMGPDYGRMFLNGDIIPEDVASQLYGYWTTGETTWNVDYGPINDITVFPKQIKTRSSVDDRTLAMDSLPTYTQLPQNLNGYQLPSSTETWKNITSNYIFGEGTTTANAKVPEENSIDIKWNVNPKQIRFLPQYPNTNNVGFRTVNGKGTSSNSQTYYGNKISDFDYSKLWDETLIPTGTTFVGWYDGDPNANGKPIDLKDYLLPTDTSYRSYSYMPLNLYMVCAKNVGKITFKDWDGKIINEQMINYGDHANLPEPSRYGYEFNGWNVDVNENSVFFNDTIFTAQYKQFDDAIYVYSNGGKFKDGDENLFKYIRLDLSNPQESIVLANEFLKEQENNLLFDGRGFYGWQATASSGVALGTISEADLSTPKNLYALWKYQYNVTFKNWDGSVLDNQIVAKYDNATSVAPNPPEREGYLFTGWSPSISYITANVTTTAQYTKSWILTIDAMGGELYGKNLWSVPVRSDLPIYSQLNFSDIKNNLKKLGHSLSDYYMDLDFKTSLGTSTKISKDTTLYVKYRRNETRISLYKNLPGESTTNDLIGNYYFGQLLKFGDFSSSIVFGNTYEKGWRMVGYAENRDGTGRVFTKDDLVPEDVPTTLYRIWERYDVTYHVNYGPNKDPLLKTQISAPSSADGKTLALDYLPSTVNFPQNVKGYVLPNNNTQTWMVGKDFKYPNYSSTVFGQNSTVGSWYPNAEDIYITWNCQPVFINFIGLYAPNAAGVYSYKKSLSSFVKNNPRYDQYMNPDDLTSLLANYELYIPSGMKFHEWYNGDPNTNGEPIDLTKPLTPNKIKPYTNEQIIQIDLYMVCANSQSAITFKDWDGTILSEQTVNYGDPINIPETHRAGYVFIGWDVNVNKNTKFTKDTVITAKYEINKHTLTLDANGGIFDGVDTTKQFQVEKGHGLNDYLSSESNNIANRNHEFEGWFTERNGGTKVSNTDTMPDDGLTLYAHWTRIISLVTYKDWNGTTLKTEEVTIGADATPPTDPTRLGYTFLKWDKPSSNIQDHTVITAQYTTNSYILTLDGNGGMVDGSSTKAIQINYEGSYDQVLTDSKVNRKYYTFNGWYTAPTGGSRYAGSGNAMPASSVTVYAQWVRSSSEVVYKDWNGDVLKTQEVTIGADATPPSDPVRAGYTFTGWDKASTNILNHTTITAQYTANRFTLTLDGNGGTIAGDETKSQTISFGESMDQIIEEGAAKTNRKYYTFDGWYTMPTGGSKYTGSGNTMPASSVTVYAHWVRNSSEVVYKDWNGDVLKTQEVEIGADATPPEDPVRPGYTFIGWDKPSTNILNHTTITAQYTANRFTLTLDGNGGAIAGEGTKSQTISFEESIDQILEEGAAKASRKYYTFDGWYTMPTGGSKCTGSGNTMPASSVTVYAHWVHNSSEVVYKDWNGDVLKTQEVEIGADATPPSDPVRAGYAFTGWDKASTNIQNHTTITAQYTANRFTLTLDGNGGTLAGDETKSQMISFGESIDQVLTDGAAKASRKYYTFNGWYTMPTGGSKYTGSGNTMPASSVTVYAHWVRNSSEVVYKDWNGDVLKTQEVGIGADATPPSDPVRAGYAFTGWDKASTNIQNHTTITAQYKANLLALTLDGNGGTIAGDATKSQMISFGESIDQVLTDGAAQASRKYYTLDGWYTMPTGGSKYTGSGNTMPGSSVTVYGHWVRNSSEVVYKDWNGDVLKTQEVAIGADATPPSDPVRSGYTFTEWDKASTNILNHTTITAQYTANGFTLTLDGNGGTIAGEETKSQTISFGESIDQELTDGATQASRKYYTFDGWYTEPTGGSKYTGSGNTMPASSVTVYAHWGRNSSEVVYKDWNGDVLKTQEVAIGGDATPPEDPVRPGYTFIGWDTPSTNIQSNTTITAVYTADDYKQTTEEKNNVAPVPFPPTIDTTTKPIVPDSGGKFIVNPENPYDVTYTKPDGTPAKDEWVGDGREWYHVDEKGKINYDWYLEGEKTWYKFNQEKGDRLGAALIGWNHEPMDDKRYFFDPTTTKMLTGWQNIDRKFYYFTTNNEGQTYFGSNLQGGSGWKYDPNRPGKPYGSMYRNEYTPDGYWVDENGVCADKK